MGRSILSFCEPLVPILKRLLGVPTKSLRLMWAWPLVLFKIFLDQQR